MPITAMMLASSDWTTHRWTLSRSRLAEWLNELPDIGSSASAAVCTLQLPYLNCSVRVILPRLLDG